MPIVNQMKQKGWSCHTESMKTNYRVANYFKSPECRFEVNFSTKNTFCLNLIINLNVITKLPTSTETTFQKTHHVYNPLNEYKLSQSYKFLQV